MKEPKVFDIEKFLNFFSKKNKPIETKDISNWLQISVRYIQKWARNNDVEFKRIHGRKYYIWDELDLYRLQDWYERKNDKEERRPIIKKRPRIKKEVKEKIKKEHKVDFKTIKDIINDGTIFPNYDYSIRYLQDWSKKNNVPFEYHFGRKYYVMTDDVISKLKEIFKDRIKYFYSTRQWYCDDPDLEEKHLLLKYANEQKK